MKKKYNTIRNFYFSKVFFYINVIYMYFILRIYNKKSFKSIVFITNTRASYTYTHVDFESYIYEIFVLNNANVKTLLKNLISVVYLK